VLLFFPRQLRFFSSQFLCLPLPRNNHIHSKSISTPGNKQVLLTKSLTTSQTRKQQHFSTASFCLVQHSSFIYFYTIPGFLPSFSSTPFLLLLLLVLPENQNLDNYLPYLPKALQFKTPHLQNNHQMSKPLSSHPPPNSSTTTQKTEKKNKENDQLPQNSQKMYESTTTTTATAAAQLLLLLLFSPKSTKLLFSLSSFSTTTSTSCCCCCYCCYCYSSSSCSCCGCYS
jgi:hypothetical protein